MAVAIAAAVHHAVRKNQEEWQKVFEVFDTDDSGFLDASEVMDALAVLFGSEVPAEKIKRSMLKLRLDEKAELDAYSFGRLVHELQEHFKNSVIDLPTFEHAGSLLGANRKLPYQDVVLHIYNGRICSTVVAICIIGNFVINIIEKQIDPDPDNMQYPAFWIKTDTTFNIIFVFELLANVWGYGGPVRKFWSNGWNVFDTVIVSVGILTMVNVLGPPLDKLKLMRAFRVFRLFRRIKALKKIIDALLHSIPGVINAFVVMFIFFCIYAILAVELFRHFGAGGVYYTYDVTTGRNATIDSITSRGYVHGIEYYGTFMRALYTLFQVMTGESWSEVVARPLLFGLHKSSAWTVSIFFVSFIILVQLVLINVVVAVLLEKFTQDEPEEAHHAHAGLEERLQKHQRKKAVDFESKFHAISSGMQKLEYLTESVTELKDKMSEVESLAHTVVDLKAKMQEMYRADAKVQKMCVAEAKVQEMYVAEDLHDIMLKDSAKRLEL